MECVCCRDGVRIRRHNVAGLPAADHGEQYRHAGQVGAARNRDRNRRHRNDRDVDKYADRRQYHRRERQRKQRTRLAELADQRFGNRLRAARFNQDAGKRRLPGCAARPESCPSRHPSSNSPNQPARFRRRFPGKCPNHHAIGRRTLRNISTIATTNAVKAPSTVTDTSIVKTLMCCLNSLYCYCTCKLKALHHA